MTIYIFVLKGDLNGENRSGAFLFLPGIYYINVLSMFIESLKYWTTNAEILHQV